jgi:hypothetical protein
MATPNNFSELLENYSIEIPIIQRDYAQGRETLAVETIRNGLLDTLYNAIESKKPVDFDFIYGSLETVAAETKFIPLDGQQRLTTLFLLHWYLACKDGKSDQEINKLVNFKYETRRSSEEFCKALVTKGIIIPKNIDGQLLPLSDIIKDAAWFFISWEKDPTIKSMLVMIDAIHAKFSISEGFYDILNNKESSPVTFQFLELSNYGLSDLLYIKMNARGKSLTDFENFKAKFEQHLQKSYNEKAKEFSSKFDGDWTELFWNYKDKDNLFDDQFMNFFRVIATNNYALDGSRENFENKVQLLTNAKVPIFYPQYEELNCFDSKCVDSVIGTLDILANGSSPIKSYLSDSTLINETDLFKKVIANDLNYTERIHFYALTHYILYNGNSDGLAQWIRVIMNLSENQIYNSADDFSKSMKSIHALLPFSAKILEYLIDPKNPVTGFWDVQVKEERIKAVLILKGSKWESIVLPIENHGYFNGQINFLLQFSGLEAAYDADNQLNLSESDENTLMSSFVEYSRKASAVFGDEGLKEFENHIWERALLCKGDYMLQQRSNYSFLIDYDRDISWKRLLRDANEDKRNLVKELFDDISIGTVENNLQSVIDNYDKDEWQWCVVKRPGMIEACGWKKYIRYYDDNNILLLESSTTSGYHKEYYSYALYLKLIEIGNKATYLPQRSIEYEKYISNLNGKAVRIAFVWEQQAWKYKVKLGRQPVEYFETEDLVIEYLKTNDYLKG